MGFVNVEGVFAPKVFVRPGVNVTLVGDFGHPGDGAGILHHPTGIEGDMLCALKIGVHNGLDLTAFPQGIVTGKKQFPVAAVQLFQGMAGLIPAVEIAGQVKLIGAGRPFPINPTAFHPMKAIVFVTVGKFVQGTAVAKQAAFGGMILVHPKVNVAGMPLQHRVQFQKLVHRIPSVK